MSNDPLTYPLGPAREIDRERPTMADLQRAQAHAMHTGDRRRAAAYEIVIMRRLEIAQRAPAGAGSQAA